MFILAHLKKAASFLCINETPGRASKLGMLLQIGCQALDIPVTLIAFFIIHKMRTLSDMLSTIPSLRLMPPFNVVANQ